MLVPLDPTHDSTKHFSVLCVDLALSNPVVYGVLDASADIIKRLPRSGLRTPSWAKAVETTRTRVMAERVAVRSILFCSR